MRDSANSINGVLLGKDFGRHRQLGSQDLILSGQTLVPQQKFLIHRTRDVGQEPSLLLFLMLTYLPMLQVV